MTQLTQQAWGKTHDGEEVHLYTFRNGQGTEVAITDFGGHIVSIKTADKSGQFADIVLGFDSVAGYEPKNPYFGATVGRYANRIGGAQFTLEGKDYHLVANEGDNSLHGGKKGFDKYLWKGREVDGDSGKALELTRVSPDGEEGYPGTLTAIVVFALTDNNELKLDYSATTDKPTVLNLTNHSYFNLTGGPISEIVHYELSINADAFTPVNRHQVPTGERRPVAGTPFDFRKPSTIGARIDQDDEQLKLAKGYDQNFILNDSGLRLAARAVDRKSGRTLEVHTTQPAVQFYSGNNLDGSVKGKGGVAYQARQGFCLETQHFPDSPNQPSFPTTELRPGQLFHQQTIYKFGVAND